MTNVFMLLNVCLHNLRPAKLDAGSHRHQVLQGRMNLPIFAVFLRRQQKLGLSGLLLAGVLQSA
ncbi:UNVERIFIED_CONTAM: hypothetical protein K2H54_050672, partial [Gekko kuhli]